MSRPINSLDPNREAGFTLVELLVAMFVLVVGVMVGWSGLMSTTVKTSARVQEESTLQTEARGVIDELVADLHQAQCDTSTTPATPPVATATGTQLTFFSPDRTTPFHMRQVSLRLISDPNHAGRWELDRRFAASTNDSTSGPPWTWSPTGAWARQIDSVTNSTVFTYYDASGAVTSTAANVATVNVALTVAPHAGLGGASTTYQTNIDLRTPADVREDGTIECLS